METGRSSGGSGGGAVSARCCDRAPAGVCRRKEEAGAGTLAADMDLHCDGAAETPAAEPPPSGKINKAAFKLFKKRKSGGTMPSIFGVKNKGDGKSSAPTTGMARSRTHDGLAEVVVLEGGRKEEPRGAGEGGGARPNPGPPRAAAPGLGSLAPGSVAKSHSFFSLLKKNGRPDPGKGDPADASKAGGKQKRGLKGIFSSLRWHKKDKRGGAGGGEGPRPARAAAPGILVLPGSLAASLECVKEEPPRAQDAPRHPAGELGGGRQAPAAADRAPEGEAPSPGDAHDSSPRSEDAAGHWEPGAGEAHAVVAEDASRTGDVARKTVPLVDSEGGSGRASAVPDPSSVDPPSDPSADRICLMFSDVTSLKSFDSLTGCGDIIADPEEEAGPSCDKQAPGPGKPVLSKKTPGGVVAYQGGGEEMASPDGVDDTYLQEFWDMLSQTEDHGQGPPEAAAKAAMAPEAKVVPETSKDARCAEAAKDASSVKRRRLNWVPTELQPKEEHKHSEKEPQEGVPNSDEGYWDSTPGPEDDSGKKAGIPRDSDSGDALYDLYADPDASPAVPPASEETACSSRLKPVSPGTITCPLRTPGSLLKDSKIPISIKHLSNLPASHPIVHQQPAKSELRRTKIPVSKVLVRRVSNRGLAGTTLRAAALHDSTKKL
ncbi:APC membrane recruitment protein 2 isoform X1 [Heterocephalus glaber]|uniref:APC membrane recruitment protein 2 n=1 Tax=Heterocephalus glaber TaxID=10181 RepID=A0AAX6PMA0_HETGA|nr:APC membrane recruitment protein 2 isoform X1 [Heterocephalus glaber]XP_004854890.1 APC membrane recruitment protein 2 isoform X1 [Heterocephalus glaber]